MNIRDRRLIVAAVFVTGLFPCLLKAARGFDPYTHGHWRATTVIKPWTADGDELYGTDGYCLYNVTPIGGSGAGNQPLGQNLLISLPDYITAITPAIGTATARDYGYLAIDDPNSSPLESVESGLLALPAGVAGDQVDMLEISLGTLPPPFGVRIGVLVGNADRTDLSPTAVGLRTTSGNWSALLDSLDATTNGLWVFFDVGPELSNDTLILSLTKRANTPATLGGLVFDSLSGPPPARPCFVAAQTATNGMCGVVWKAGTTNDDSVILFGADGSVLDAGAPLSGWRETAAVDGVQFGCAVGRNGVRMLTLKIYRSTSTNVTGVVSFTYSDTPGIGTEAGVSRRDPSDVVKVANTWYVWYSRMTDGSYQYPSGYDATVWYATSTNAGLSWTERGEALPRGPAGAWDCNSVFTPNILCYKGTWYLYYTAVGTGFNNSGYTDANRTAIGVASAPAPDGPWTKFSGNPILTSTTNNDLFDSYRVDDSCLAERNGEVWLYYKGRQWNNTPSNTKMGVATSASPFGPFTRMNGGQPVVGGGHEVQIWTDASEGVYALIGNTGPVGIRNTMQYAADGLHFSVVANFAGGGPHAPGVYRADLTGGIPDGFPTWGIHIAHSSSSNVSLGRFTMNFAFSNSVPEWPVPAGAVEEGQLPGTKVMTLPNPLSRENFTNSILPLADHDLFSLSGANLVTASVLDSRTAAIRVLVLAATGPVSGEIDRLLRISVQPSSGFLRWRLDHFTVEELNDPSLESTLWGDNADADGDGLATLDEYLADTDPRDSSSRVIFRIHSTGPDQADLEWSAGAASSQVVEAAYALGSTTNWQAIERLDAPTPASSIMPIVLDRGPRFFRLCFERPLAAP